MTGTVQADYGGGRSFRLLGVNGSHLCGGKDFPRLYQTLIKARYNILKLLHLHMPQMPEEYHRNLSQKAYKRIDAEAHAADKRPAYAHVASLIQEFASLPGAKPLAKEMVLCLRLAYMRRPAYMDELNKLKLDSDSSK